MVWALFSYSREKRTTNSSSSHFRFDMNKLIGLLTTAILLSACSDNSSGPAMPGGLSTNGESSFSVNVRPLFSTYGCLGCHGGTSGLSVGSVTGLLQGGDHGPAIIHGNANSSILIQKLMPGPAFGSRMPVNGPYIPDSTISIIKKWINEGAKNN